VAGRLLAVRLTHLPARETDIVEDRESDRLDTVHTGHWLSLSCLFVLSLVEFGYVHVCSVLCLCLSLSRERERYSRVLVHSLLFEHRVMGILGVLLLPST
jgi:hypothetical protein